MHLCLSQLECFVALQADKDALEQLADAFEIDFVSLSFTRSREDVTAARDYLDSLGMVHTKVGLGQNPILEAGRTGVLARTFILGVLHTQKAVAEQQSSLYRTQTVWGGSVRQLHRTVAHNKVH